MENLKEKALSYHQHPQPGKIAVVPTKPYADPADLSLAYSPGVAYPCKEIKENPAAVRHYTGRSNLVAVISNGTAVLGLGNIGPLAAKPVMEGKALLFKIYAGLDAFDIELDADDPEAFIAAVKAMTPTFGGINLEDIKAPECFEIERRLREECDIPVMHDDQHGTAIISSAALLNALEIQEKRIDSIKLVVNGAGAAAIACTRLYIALGVRRENIVMCDSRGVIRADRAGLSGAKKEFATARDLHTLAEALKDADVFLGLSVADVMTKEMLLSMAPKPIVFALANPDQYGRTGNRPRPRSRHPHRPYIRHRTKRFFQSDKQRARIPLHFPRRARLRRVGNKRSHEARRSACGSSHRARTRH